MLAMNWMYPLYKITCVSEKMIPLHTSFLNYSQRLSAEQETVFNPQESLSQTEMSLEFGHFQPELWLSSSFICLLLQWPLNGYPGDAYCPCCHQGYCTEKCIWSCRFLFRNLRWFLFSWGALCLASILLQFLFLPSSTCTWPSSPGECVMQDAWRSLCRRVRFPSLCHETQSYSKLKFLTNLFLTYANTSPWYAQVRLSVGDPTPHYIKHKNTSNSYI